MAGAALAALTLLCVALAADGPWTEDELVERALQQSTAVAIGAAAVDGAAGARQSASAYPNPEIRLGVDDPAGSLGPPSTFARLRLSLDRPWTVAARVAAARAELRAVEVDADAARHEVAASTLALSHQLSLLDALAGATGRAAESAAEYADAVAAARDLGQATALQWLDADGDRRDAAAAHDRVLASRTEAAGVLAVLLELDAPPELAAVDHRVRLAGELPDLSALLDAARGHAPALRRADAYLDAARSGGREARGAWIPWFRFVQAGLSSGGGPATTELQVAIDVPLLAPGLGATRTANAEIARREHEQRAATREVERQVAAAYRAASAAHDRWRTEAEHLDAARNVVGGATAADRRSAAALAQRLAEAEAAEIAAVAAAIEAFDHLAQLTGRPVP